MNHSKVLRMLTARDKELLPAALGSENLADAFASIPREGKVFYGIL